MVNYLPALSDCNTARRGQVLHIKGAERQEQPANAVDSLGVPAEVRWQRRGHLQRALEEDLGFDAHETEVGRLLHGGAG